MGSAWRARRWPDICSSAARRSAADISRTPAYKEVPNLDDVGFPIAEIAADGSCIVTKASNTGGLVDARTVKEQLLYEIHDPAEYLTPDVVADISDAEVAEVGRDRVRLTAGAWPPAHADVEGKCVLRRRLARRRRNLLRGRGRRSARAVGDGCDAESASGANLQLRFDLIGVMSVLGDDTDRLLNATRVGAATDVRLRVAAKHEDAALIDRMLRELTALWTGGPAGGGGVRVAKRQRLSQKSCLVPRERAPASYAFV